MRAGRVLAGLIGLYLGSLSAIAAQPGSAQSADSAPTTPAQLPTATQSLELTLADVVSLLLQNNRELKNAALDRIVQRQELREAESAFTWRVQPLLGIGVSQLLSPSSTSSGSLGAVGLGSFTVSGPGSFASGGAVFLSPETTYTRSTQVVGRVAMPLGTTITLNVDPFRSANPAILEVTQPLLRGFGSEVNQAEVKVARLTESRSQLELRKTLSDRITEAAILYRNLAKAQESLRIQEISIQNRRQQLEFLRILVEAGRRARADLVEIEADIASLEAANLLNRNQLAQAQSELLRLLGLTEMLNLVVPQTVLVDLNQSDNLNLQTLRQLQVEQLLQTAYTKRPEYLQVQLDIQATELRLQAAQNRQEWGLDLQGTASAGPTSQLAAGLVLTRVFDDQSLETAVQRQRVTLRQRQNELARLTQTLKLEVNDRVRDVNSALAQVAATEEARKLAQLRAENARIQYQRSNKVDIFRLLELQKQVIDAQNNELNARIELLNALTRLDQTVGITLESWKEPVNASQLLKEP